MGGGYSDVYADFAQEAVANARNGQVNILVLPLAYSIPPDGSTDAERAANVLDAEERRFQIEEACKRAAPPDVSCQAALGAPSHTVVVPDQDEELKIPTGTRANLNLCAYTDAGLDTRRDGNAGDQQCARRCVPFQQPCARAAGRQGWTHYLCHCACGRSPPKMRRLSFDRGTSIGYTKKRFTAAHSHVKGRMLSSVIG